MSGNSKESPLFRQEVFDAKKDTWLGEIVLIRPTSFSFLTIAAVICATFVIGYLIWGEYTRKAKVTGYVVPNQGLIKVAAQQSGLIAELRVKEGQQVTKGDVLAVLNSERATASGDAQAEMAKQMQLRRESLTLDYEKINSLYDQQTRAMSDRLVNLHTELGQIDRSIVIQQDRMRIDDRLIEQQRKLFAEKFISELALQQKEQDRLAGQGTLENLKRSRTNLLRDIGSLSADTKSLPLKRANELSGVNRSLAMLEQDRIENESRRQLYITAPQTGTVTAIFADPGKLAVAGQPLLNLIPQGSELQADLYVPSRSIGFVREGNRALLQYQAFPYQKFGTHDGSVTKVSRTAVSANELPFPAQQGELYYVVTIKPKSQTVTAYGKAEPLQSGMLVDASLLLDRRTLLEWVFEPLYSISGKWGS
jgi:membrane fusion protein